PQAATELSLSTSPMAVVLLDDPASSQGTLVGNNMGTVNLSDVQRLNFNVLLSMTKSVQEDPGAACCKFGLRGPELEALSGLSPDAILSIVANAGEESLFCPRNDLVELLSLPPGLSGTISYARRTRRG